MAKIMDLSFLFQKMSGISNFMSTIPLSDLSSRSVQDQLRAAGINTSSKRYQTVIREMTRSAGGRPMHTNIQAIKNLMKQYDEDGDYINPVNGLAGLCLKDSDEASRKRIISIPESSRDEMFEQEKMEFLREDGILNGDTTKRSDVYTNLYRKMKKEDRLAAGYTMDQYERQYRQAFIAAVKEADPGWEIGSPIKQGALDGVTRESVEAGLTKSGNILVKAEGKVDITI